MLSDVIRPGTHYIDNCPVLTRTRAFVVQAGLSATLEYGFRDNQGKPIDLSEAVQQSDSSQSAAAPYTVLARIREVMLMDRNLWEVTGEITDASNGVVQISPEARVFGQPGLYHVDLAIMQGTSAKLIRRALLAVEPSSFAPGNGLQALRQGSLSLSEIRMRLMDSAAAENALLANVEFGDDQIVQAVLQPIQYFNEALPPLSIRYDTTNFPFRNAWVDAAIGYLLRYASENYQRNRLQGSAGGVDIDDKNKAAPYAAAAERYLAAWRDFVINRKTAMNQQECIGSF